MWKLFVLSRWQSLNFIEFSITAGVNLFKLQLEPSDWVLFEPKADLAGRAKDSDCSDIGVVAGVNIIT